MKKELLIDIFYDIIGSFLYALGIYTFASKASFAPGGITGVALILNYLFQLPIGLLTIILNIPILVFCYSKLTKKFFIKSAKTIIISTIFLDYIMPLLPTYDKSPLLASLFTGLLVGLGSSFFYRRSSSTGGIDFLIFAIRKRWPHFSLGQILMVLNLIIILLGSYVYNDVDAILYGLIATFADTIVLDKVMYGLGAGKVLNIITKKGNGFKIAKAIDEIAKRGSTLINVTGTYSKDDKDMILCACSNSQFFRIRNIALDIDREALIIISESNEVYGSGFRNIKDI